MLACAVAAAGCRQPDGVIPAPEGEQTNKTEDVSRDLQNLAGRAAGAATDLNDDLSNLSRDSPPADLAAQLTSSLDAALAGKTLGQDEARQLAFELFVAVTARDLSARQIETLQTNLKAALAKAGVEAAKADQVAAVASSLQTAFTNNKKRWYHLL